MAKDENKKINLDFEIIDKCELCGNKVTLPSGRIEWLGIDFWYVICPKCGLKFMNPRPTQLSYDNFYKDMFWQQKIRNEGFKQSGQIWMGGRYVWDDEKKWKPKEGIKNRILKQKEQRIKTIIPVLEKYGNMNSSSNILEVGCGFGVALNEINKVYKSNIYAIEPSDEAIKKLKSIKKLKIIGRYANDIKKIKKQKFDVIIFSHALENLTNPFEIIKISKKLLNKKGIIYTQTPNLLTFDQMNPYHPFIFSKNSLEIVAKNNKLKFKMISNNIDKMLISLLIK